mmetsp:Transcript_11547/g.18412  ORF Transcript_11547/g.18412 Transcript_11547/m.18412 type:complete len:380 (+) Transcript_11547:94-1233(+)
MAGWFENSPLWDQLALKEGKVERQGWLTYYDTAKPRGERRFFIMRGVNLTCFESEVMEDSGVRVACLNKSQISYTEPRAICLAGDWYSIRAGFVWDSESRSLSFECEDEADARAWVALAITKEGATAGQAPIDAQAHTGTTPQQPHQNGGTSLRARPPVPAYPHESEYGGGKDYVSAPYNGGKSILEPEIVFGAKEEDEWRCWPSGPLPPNSKILGTDQNIMSYAADEGVEVMATEGNGKFGIGIGLKQAHRGIEISDGRFGVQISEMAPGGAAELARNAGQQIRVGDYLLAIDGWSCSQRHSSEVAEKMVGEEGSEITISVARPIGPSRVFAQPWWWIQAGVTRFDTTLKRSRISSERTVLEKIYAASTGWIPGAKGL